MNTKELADIIAKVLSESPSFMALLSPNNGADKKAPVRRTKKDRMEEFKKQITLQSYKRKQKHEPNLNQ